MKIIITILILVVINSLAFAQQFDLKKINKTDNNGLRQGLWFFYKLDTTYKRMYSGRIAAHPIKNNKTQNYSNQKQDSSGWHIDTLINLAVSKIGYYKNNKKDSIWTIFDTLKSYPLKRVPNFSEKVQRSSFKLKYLAILKNDSNAIIKEYYSNGNIKNEFEISNKLIVGQTKFYNQNGTLEFIVNINPNMTYYDGSEYNLLGRKVKDKKFNMDFVNERIHIDDFFNKINK